MRERLGLKVERGVAFQWAVAQSDFEIEYLKKLIAGIFKRLCSGK